MIMLTNSILCDELNRSVYTALHEIQPYGKIKTLCHLSLLDELEEISENVKSKVIAFNTQLQCGD
jgi:hypothetical protein